MRRYHDSDASPRILALAVLRMSWRRMRSLVCWSRHMAEVDEVAGRRLVLKMELRPASGVHLEGTMGFIRDIKAKGFLLRRDF